jgi:hypothetical protein
MTVFSLRFDQTNSWCYYGTSWLSVFRYNKILIDCVFGNSKFVVPSTLSIVSVSGTTKLLFPHTLQHKFTSLMKILIFVVEIFEILKFHENFEIMTVFSLRNNVHETIFRFIMQNTGKRCLILLVFVILRWSFNYESKVFRYNKILIDCVFGNSKYLLPVFCIINLNIVSWTLLCYFPSHS